MQWPELIEGRLVRRYKRFLADVELLNGSKITAVVANTGSLLSCVTPGRPVWLRDDASPTRKYRYTWVMIKPGRSLVSVDTAVPNRVVYESAKRQRIPELAGFNEYRREVPYGKNSRADLCCRVHETDMLRRVWVEVKSTTLVRDRIAAFPDAVTERQHLANATFAVQDMRELAYDGQFSAAINFFDAWGYFDDATNLDVLRRIRRALKPGGRFLLDFTNRDHTMRHFKPRSWVRRSDGVIVNYARRLDCATGRLQLHHLFIAPETGAAHEMEIDHALPSSDEFVRLFERAGFTEARLVSSPDGGELTMDSPRLAVIGLVG